MATTRRAALPWLVLAILAVLLVTLGMLQYRWTRELGRAAAERRQADLERASRRFAAALQRELGQVGIAFFADAGPPPADRRALLLERLQGWQERTNAGLVAGLLLATRGASGRVLLEEALPAEAAFRELPWPEELAGLRERLANDPGPASEVRPGALIERPLGLLLPLFGGFERAGQGPTRLSIEGIVVVRLDESFLRERVLPRITELSIGPPATSPFAVAVLRRADRSVFYASQPDAVAGDARPGDVELGLPRRGPLPGADGESPFRLVARHRGGAFEAAVASVERRNLATGFGVLALLGATALVLVASAQRAQRLARQQLEFVTGVTHELNTPLAGIRSAAQNLAVGIVTDPAQVRRYGDLIEKEGARLTALVAQVLDFAGIESPGRAYAREPVFLPELVGEVLRDNGLVLEQAGIAVERDLPDDLPPVSGDAPALRRAIANLVANAAKFAAAGGWIAVRARPSRDGRAVELRVEDRGPGIPREERKRVFEPFYRGPLAERNHAPGSGLGLALVRHVARAHGGSVRAEAREGGGAAIVLELPLAAGAGA